jgi:hypothetical protein
MRIGQCRIELERLTHTSFGFVQPAKALKRKRQIAENKRVTRRKPGCHFQLPNRLRQLTQLQLAQTKHMKQFGVPWGCPQGLQAKRNSRLEIAMLEGARRLFALPDRVCHLRNCRCTAAFLVFLTAAAGTGVVASGLHADRLYRHRYFEKQKSRLSAAFEQGHAGVIRASISG